MAMNIKSVVFSGVTLFNYVASTNILSEPVVSIFYPEDGGIKFLQSIDTYLSA
jgi:hypothetical protein